MPPQDPFPASDFDAWASSYDHDVAANSTFPFAGYEKALDTVVRLAAPMPGMSVLDVGTGTGNLALRFAERGCRLTCTDFSEAMLTKAREKLPEAQFVLQDLSADWPAQLSQRFDRIVSAYVFHHFDLSRKTSLASDIVAQHLAPGGKLVIADVSFPDEDAMHTFAAGIGHLWEEEPYWLANDSIAALTAAGLRVQYVQVSSCAGVYCVESGNNVRAQS